MQQQALYLQNLCAKISIERYLNQLTPWHNAYSLEVRQKKFFLYTKTTATHYNLLCEGTFLEVESFLQRKRRLYTKV